MVARTQTPEPDNFPKQPQYGTWVKDRTPQFKTHTSVGLAKTAISTRTNRKDSRHRVGQKGHLVYERACEGGYIYRWNGEKWMEIACIEPDTFAQDHWMWRKEYRIEEMP